MEETLEQKIEIIIEKYEMGGTIMIPRGIFKNFNQAIKAAFIQDLAALVREENGVYGENLLTKYRGMILSLCKRYKVDQNQLLKLFGNISYIGKGKQQDDRKELEG